MIHMLGFGNCVPKIVSTFQDSRVALLIYEVCVMEGSSLNAHGYKVDLSDECVVKLYGLR